ncbi:MAG TPA: hypothetical protein V6C93_26935 [Allocoleopsis sp.]
MTTTILIDDVIEGVVRVLDKIPQPNPDWSSFVPEPGTSYAPYKIYNIGNNKPVELTRFIEVLENCLGRKAEKICSPYKLEMYSKLTLISMI